MVSGNALMHTDYFKQLSQYGVTSVSSGPSVAAGNCRPPPATSDDVVVESAYLMLCLQQLHSFPAHAVYNIFLPPQTVPVVPTCTVGQTAAWHDHIPAPHIFPPIGVFN